MTDWQARYAANDTPWDKGAAAPPLLAWLKTHSCAGSILVPGCGFGHDVRAIAPSTKSVLGLDLSPSAIAGAESFPRSGTETYAVADFFEFHAENPFDIIFEHTCFCAIDPADRRRYVQAAARLLKPGGRLIGIFYLDPGHAQGPPFRVNDHELAILFEPQFLLVKSCVPAVAFPGREGREQWREYQKKA